MGIREALKARRALPRSVERDIPGMGLVLIRRLTTVQAMAIEKDPVVGYAPSVVAATVLDEQGVPLFDKAADTASEDWAVMNALYEASESVNKLSAEEAEKK